MRKASFAALLLVLSSSSAVLAQSGAPTRPAGGDVGNRALKAARLPGKAQEVRSKGVPEGEMREALKAAKDKGVPAGEMSDVADEQSKAIDEHGPIDNFGAFVKGKLNEGLRGRELASAIKAEHVKRGKGKGAGKVKADKPEKAKADKVKDDKAAKADRDDAAEREKEAKEKAERERGAKAEKEAKDKAAKGKGRGKP